MKDGGPAFGGYVREGIVAGQEYDVPVMGMSLRDYFAAAVVNSAIRLLADSHSAYGATTSAAKIAYEVADAMLTERDRK